MAFNADFSLFNGKLNAEVIADWLEKKERAPLPPTNSQMVPENPPQINLTSTYIGIFEFVRGLILRPREYGLEGAYAEDDCMFRLLGPFFFPGLEKEDLNIGPSEASIDHINAWREIRNKKFISRLQQYEKDFEGWKGKRNPALPVPPTPIPEFRTVNWEFQNYDNVDAAGKSLKPDYMHTNCTRILKYISMPIPGREGPLNPRFQLMKFFDVGAALGYLFTIHPSGLGPETPLKEKIDKYYYPAVILFAGFLSAMPVPFGMTAVQVVRRAALDPQRSQYLDCVDGFFSSTAHTEPQNQVEAWDPLRMTGITDLPEKFHGKEAVFLCRTTGESIPPTLKNLVVSERFSMLKTAFSELTAALKGSFPVEKAYFPPVWPLLEVRHSALAGDFLREKLTSSDESDFATKFYTELPNPGGTQLLLKAQLLSAFPGSDMYPHLRKVLEYTPTYNTREILSANRRTHHYPFLNLFRSDSIRYTKIFMETGRIDPKADLKADASELDNTSGNNYSTHVSIASSHLEEFEMPILDESGPFSFPDATTNPPLSGPEVKFSIALGTPDPAKHNLLQGAMENYLPRYVTDLNNVATVLPATWVITSAQGIVYCASKIPSRMPQSFGHCAETYPIWYYSVVAQIAESKRVHDITPGIPQSADAPRQLEVKPVPLAGISVRPGDALRNVFRATYRNFGPEPFSHGRIAFNPIAVQDDSQAQAGTILVEDPCHNCKGLLRLFQNVSDDLDDYDFYTKPMRRVQDSVNGVRTWTELIPGNDEVAMNEKRKIFYPLHLKANPASWQSGNHSIWVGTPSERRIVERPLRESRHTIVSST